MKHDMSEVSKLVWQEQSCIPTIDLIFFVRHLGTPVSDLFVFGGLRFSFYKKVSGLRGLFFTLVLWVPLFVGLLFFVMPLYIFFIFLNGSMVSYKENDVRDSVDPVSVMFRMVLQSLVLLLLLHLLLQ